VTGIIFANSQHILAIEPWDKGMLGTTSRFDYEVRDEKEFFKAIASSPRAERDGEPCRSHPRPQTDHFDPAKFKDEYELALRKLVKGKAAGKPMQAHEENEDRSNVIGLMEGPPAGRGPHRKDQVVLDPVRWFS
jgi:DNA end-binding protein Ku